MQIHISISTENDRNRLDAVIAEALPDVSRSLSARYIANGYIRVNQIVKKPGYRVKTGDRISGQIPDPDKDPQIVAEPMPLDIVYEDDQILVLDKPPGLVSHPAPGNLSGTLVNGLLHHYPKIVDTCEDPFRSGIVHRLDKDTSGLMVVAKTVRSFLFLQKEFKYRRVKKRYLALVQGHLKEDQGRIDLPIGRHPVKRKMMAVQPETGRKATSLWQVKDTFKETSLVEVDLKTGRTHQIRVHFYAIGHPLVGESVYQYRKLRTKKSAVPRQMLHSGFLSFRHPYSGKRVEFNAGLPEDFLLVISKLD